ncbi:MAG: lipopolysaccharide assembly protein LapA domain-containing protein [Candidatus Krumholzibacteriia bacterium]
MWVIKGLLFIALLLVLVYFFVANSGQTVDLNVFGKRYLDVSIFWVVMVSFVLGFTVAFVVAAFRELQSHNRQRRLRRALRSKEREIADLRTLPLRDLDETGETAPPRDRIGAPEREQHERG